MRTKSGVRTGDGVPDSKMGTKSGVRTGDTEKYGAAPYTKIADHRGGGFGDDTGV